MTEAHGGDGPRPSPLNAAHERAGATFTDFAGHRMPLRYASELAEHRAVRERAGLFDLSHMGEVRVSGPEAGRLLDRALAGRLAAIAPGRAKYSLLLAEDGGVLDDLVVYRTGETEFLVVANAANRLLVATELAARGAGLDSRVEDLSDAVALLAVQGPAALAVLEATPGLAPRDPGARLADLRYYRCLDAGFEGTSVLVSRTGYTGEDGFELYLEPGRAPALWEALLAAGAPHGLQPAGLACRDTLRLEAGMALHGHELGPDVLPAQAGLGRIVAFDKDEDFVGRAALVADDGSASRVLVGLAGEGRRAARAGYGVLADGSPVGVVTSGALSPTLERPIAMAFVPATLAAPGTALTVDVRGTALPFTVTALPFHRRKKN